MYVEGQGDLVSGFMIGPSEVIGARSILTESP